MSFDGLDKNAFWKILPPTLVLRKKKKKKKFKVGSTMNMRFQMIRDVKILKID